jgi:hypothetical protein
MTLDLSGLMRLNPPSNHRGVFRVSGPRPRGENFIVFVDAALSLDEWETETVVFEPGEFANLDAGACVRLVQQRLDAAMSAIEDRVARAGRSLMPLAEVVGRETAKG